VEVFIVEQLLDLIGVLAKIVFVVVDNVRSCLGRRIFCILALIDCATLACRQSVCFHLNFFVANLTE